MGKIESQINDYPSHKGYMSPDEVDFNSQTPRTKEEHDLYAAAHCMVSERNAKYDLVNMVYAILKRESDMFAIAEMVCDRLAGDEDGKGEDLKA